MNDRNHNTDPYANIVALYDLEHDTFEDDLNVIVQVASNSGGPVLEFGTGTGRVAQAVASAGITVTGIDTSASMLAVGRKRMKARQLERLTTLVELDMTDAANAPGGPFDTVVASLNALLHLTSSDDQRRAIQQAHAALTSDGVLIIDVLNPAPDYLIELHGQLGLESTFDGPDSATIQKFSSRQVRPADQLIETDIWYDIVRADHSVQRVPTSFSLRYLYPSELELMLELAGFRHWNLFGSYEMEAFDDASERLLVIAEK